MHRHLTRLLLTSLAALLTACAGTPPLQAPRPSTLASRPMALAPSAAVQQTGHLQQHLDAARTIVYSQNFGGGGAGLGVLLGPLGVAANIAMIETTTQADTAQLQGRLQVEPLASFRQAAADLGWTLAASAGPQDVRATPYLLISKTEPGMLHVGAALALEADQAGQPWRGRYLVQLPLQYSPEQLAALDDAGQQQLRAETQRGFAVLLRQLQRDTPDAAAQEPRLTFQSAYLTPRFEFEQTGSLIGTHEQRIWLRSVGGVFAVLPAQVRYTLDKR